MVIHIWHIYLKRQLKQTYQDVQNRLIEIAEDSARVMEKASKAFNSTDAKLAEEAIAIADATGEKALALDELVIRVLAKQSPVARDLRLLVSALRISASLERMGALAGHIAAIARYRYPVSAVPADLRATFSEMGELDVQLANQVVQLLKSSDVDFARQIQAQDERVDALHRHVFDVVLSDFWKENAMFTVDVTLASRYYERFADHVVDISSTVSYLTTGDWADAE